MKLPTPQHQNLIFGAVVLAKRLVDYDFVLINWLWEIVFLCVKGRAACFKKSLPFKLAHIR